MNKLLRILRQINPLALMAVLLVLAGGVVSGIYVYDKHRWAQSRLAELEPRHARLQGLAGAAVPIEAALAEAKSRLPRFGYPPDMNATDAGNDAQQKIRLALGGSALDVQSIQALAPANEDGRERLPFVVRAEGDLLALQTALVGLSAIQPVVLTEALTVQQSGNFKPDASPRLSIQLNLAVLRLKP